MAIDFSALPDQPTGAQVSTPGRVNFASLPDQPQATNEITRRSFLSSPLARFGASAIGAGAGATAGAELGASAGAFFPPAIPFTTTAGALIGAGAGTLAAQQARRMGAAALEYQNPEGRGQAMARSLGLAPEDFAQGFGAETFARGAGWAIPRLGAALGVGRTREQLMDAALTKGIRPSVSGKGTFAQTQQYHAKAKQAINTIAQFKSELALPDETGQAVARLPESLKDLSQAIEQTKFAIFKRYNAAATEAGKQGVTVQTRSASQAAQQVANTTIIKRYYPEIKAYADTWAKRLRTAGAHSPEEIQDLIAKMNADLETYYRNPQPGSAAKAVIDAGIANNLRKELDTQIERATGQQYQLLKNLYGSLKTIEKDVNRRMVVVARQNAKGLIDFSDIFSGAEMVHGILTTNPATFATGAAARGIARWYKYLNDPNVMVKRMFQAFERKPGVLSRVAPYVGQAATPVISGLLGASRQE